MGVKTTPSAGLYMTHKTVKFYTHFASEDVSSDCCCNLNDDDQREKDGKLEKIRNERYLSELHEHNYYYTGFYTHQSLICTTKFHTAKLIQPFVWFTQIPHYLNYRCDHAVVLFPGTAAAEEGDEENHHTDSDEDNGSS